MSEASLGSIEERLKSAEKEREKLSDAIFGNGREGLQARTVRIEEKLDNYLDAQKETKQDMDKQLGDISDAISNNNSELTKISREIASIANSVKIHIEDTKGHSLTGLIRNAPKSDLILFFVIGILLWAFLHSIVPENLNLWELISSYLGF